MSSLLSSTRNTRFLPDGSGRYIRSDAPVNLTDEEARWLLARNITTVVDLRSAEEIASRPCPLAAREGFHYHHLPVTGGGDTPSSREQLHRVYRGMLDAQMERILDTLLTAPSGALYFCTAGKDRTGVVSAALLRRLGVDDETIVADYMQSLPNLLDMLTAYAAEHPAADLSIILPQEENIRRLLAHL